MPSDEHDDDTLVSVTTAARRVGVCCSTLSRQIHAGKIRSHGGKVRVSEIIEDRERNLNAAIWEGRRRAALGVDGASDQLLRDDASTMRHATNGLHATADDGAAPRDYDDAPIGSRPFHIGANGDVPLSRGLVRRLGEMIGSDEPDNPPSVAYDLATTAVDILQQEIGRLKAKAGEPE